MQGVLAHAGRAYLTGGAQDLGGMMGFGPFMGLYGQGYFGNPGMTAAYDAQRQSVLYGPRVPNLPPASETPAGMSDQQLEDELLRREAARQADER